MKIALAQINPTVGDIRNNARLIRDRATEAAGQEAELVVFPELALIGYPPKDLLLKPAFINDNLAMLEQLAEDCRDIPMLIGHVCRHNDTSGRELHNAVSLLQGGRVAMTYYKQLLPTYDVFDESRYFQPSASASVMTSFKPRRIGLTICEDLWNDPDALSRPLYDIEPIRQLVSEQVDAVINISASPYVIDKHPFRCRLFAEQARRYGIPIVYVNQVGGNDELVFDGNSCVFDATGERVAQARDFDEELLVVELPPAADRQSSPATAASSSAGNVTRAQDGRHPATANKAVRHEPREGIASVYAALLLGLGDYVRKCRFEKVVLGLSGGVDSALTAALAADALGPEQVLGVAMPSRYSSGHSLTDAEILARLLGIGYRTIPIEQPHAAMEAILAEAFQGYAPDVTEENIQARVRGNILMALSNKYSSLLLTTGNKSELAVGYCTLYGDMAGGLALISDVPKTMVYDLCHFINRDGERIPQTILTKPPSAELRPDQVDQDSLPPYDCLDAILQRYIEQEQSRAEIVAAGYDADTVARVIRLVDRNEYKRKQAAPGIKVTSRAFGFGRRMPIAQNYQPLT